MKKALIYGMIFSMAASIQISAQSWSSLTRLTWNAENSYQPAIAADSGSGIHIAWKNSSSTSSDIFYKRSTDSGSTWLGLTRLTWSSGNSDELAVASDSGSGIHVAWYDDTWGDNEILYKRSTNSGVTWMGLARLTWNSGESYSPAITADSSNNIYIIWYDDTMGNYEIFFKSSTNSGAAWSTPTRLTWNLGSSRTPSIAADPGNNTHVVWSDNSMGSYEIFYKRSTDGGVTWSVLTRLTWNAYGSYNPVIAADSGNGLHVAWEEAIPGKWDIFYKRSTNSGATWSAPTRMTWTSGDSWYPSITADTGSGVHIIWSDDNPGDKEIFYKNSTNSGVSWSALNRLTWNSGQSWFPSIAADMSDTIHATWGDDSPGDYEIFYKNRK